MARVGTLVLPNLMGIAFVPVAIDEMDLLLPDLPVTDPTTLGLLKGDVKTRLNVGTIASRITEITAAL
jgi:transposase